MTDSSPSRGWRALGGASALLLVPMLSVGCGGTGTVSGKVTVDGKPLTGGLITFTPADGKGVASGNLDESGNYSVSGVPVGKVKVTINTEHLKPGAGMSGPVGISGESKPPPSSQGAGPRMPGAPGGAPAVGPPKDVIDRMRQEKGIPAEAGKAEKPLGTYVKINPKYHGAETSGLEIEVTRGNNKHDFDLKE